MTVALMPRSRVTPALERHWTNPLCDRPIPLRGIHARRARGRRGPPVVAPELRHPTGDAGVPLDFTRHMQRLCGDIVSRCSCFHHIDMSRLLVSVTRSRSGRTTGLVAKITPFRFRGGELVRRRRGRLYRVQRYWMDGVEVLYLVTFCLPRFLDLSFDEKMVTVFHELYHIAPEFNGDLRRHGGRYCIHTRSQKGYDRQMAGLAREYLQQGADPGLHAFLRLDFQQLRDRHGQLLGAVVPAPKLIPVA